MYISNKNFEAQNATTGYCDPSLYNRATTQNWKYHLSTADFNQTMLILLQLLRYLMSCSMRAHKTQVSEDISELNLPTLIFKCVQSLV
jgi:hypothetical protein